MLPFHNSWSKTVEFTFIYDISWKLLRTWKMSLWVKWPSLTLWGIISSYQGGIQADSVDSGQIGNFFIFFFKQMLSPDKNQNCLPSKHWEDMILKYKLNLPMQHSGACHVEFTSLQPLFISCTLTYLKSKTPQPISSSCERQRNDSTQKQLTCLIPKPIQDFIAAIVSVTKDLITW